MFIVCLACLELKIKKVMFLLYLFMNVVNTWFERTKQKYRFTKNRKEILFGYDSTKISNFINKS